jgi:2-polyprenyl-3-methyl-5-hydroxy-6-metoxy-1,4-benzoquinol methylase
MTDEGRAAWERRHRESSGASEPEPFVSEMLSRLPVGVALDVAAGRGRHSLLLARRGAHVVAVDYSREAMTALAAEARAKGLRVSAVVADMCEFAVKADSFEVILNVSFLERAAFAGLKAALKPGGMLLEDTFLVEQAKLGHPRNPRFLLRDGELRELLSGLELLEYREGMVVYADGSHAYRASALARKGVTRGSDIQVRGR